MASDRIPVPKGVRRYHIEVLSSICGRDLIDGTPQEIIAIRNLAGNLNAALADYDAVADPPPVVPPVGSPPNGPLPPGWEPPPGTFSGIVVLPAFTQATPLHDDAVDPHQVIVVPIIVPTLPYSHATLLSMSACEHGNTLDPTYMQSWLSTAPGDTAARLGPVAGGTTPMSKLDDASMYAGGVVYFNLRFWCPDFNNGAGGITADKSRTILLNGQWPH
jgi:hypothetical protein